MINQLIESLTKEQKAELLMKDIPPQLISAWKTGRRRPTYAQCIRFAEVTKCNVKDLLFEIALMDITEEERKNYEKPYKP